MTDLPALPSFGRMLLRPSHPPMYCLITVSWAGLMVTIFLTVCYTFARHVQPLPLHATRKHVPAESYWGKKYGSDTRLGIGMFGDLDHFPVLVLDFSCFQKIIIKITRLTHPKLERWKLRNSKTMKLSIE